MEFTVTWTVDYTLATDPRNEYGPNILVKYPDAYNFNMYLTDNLGYRYDHVATDGAARDGGSIYKNQVTTLTGAFVFSPAQLGAWLFTFHDDDQKVVIPNINLNISAP